MSMKLTVDYEGFNSTLEALVEKVGLRSGKIVEQQAEKIMEESVGECPKDTGALVSTAFVDMDRGTFKNAATFGYNGKATVNPKSGETVSEYMIAVHEDLTAVHPNGKAKFLEDPVNRYAAEFEKTLGEKIADIFRGK